MTVLQVSDSHSFPAIPSGSAEEEPVRMDDILLMGHVPPAVKVKDTASSVTSTPRREKMLLGYKVSLTETSSVCLSQ